jgi:hypothetical protein
LSAAQAGGVSVSGSYELSYTNLDHEKVSGNKLGVNKNITFGASGDVSDGGAVTWATTVAMNDGFSGLSSASLSINMGGIATLAYDSGTGGYGANAVDNIVPTAWEEVDYGFATGISDVGAVSATKGVINLTVKAPVAGTGFSLSYAPRLGGGHISDGGNSGSAGPGYKGIDLVLDVVDYNASQFGFRWGMAAQTELHQVTCDRIKKDYDLTTGVESSKLHSCEDGLKHNPYAGTMFTKLQLGPIHMGAQATFKNLATTKASAVMNQRSIVTGIAAIFGDTLSLSYGVGFDKNRYNNRNRGLAPMIVDQDPNRCVLKANVQDCPEVRGGDEHEYVTTKYRGFSAALNIGPVALKGTKNHADSDDSTGIYGHDTTHSEINLSIAF